MRVIVNPFLCGVRHTFVFYGISLKRFVFVNDLWWPDNILSDGTVPSLEEGIPPGHGCGINQEVRFWVHATPDASSDCAPAALFCF